MQSRHRIGDILLEQRLITEEQLREGLLNMEQRGGTLGEHLVELGHLNEDALLDAVSRQTGIPFVNLVSRKIPPEVLKLVDFEVVKAKRVLPIAGEDKKIAVGVIDPTDRELLAELEFKSSRDVVPMVMSVAQFGRALEFFESHGYGTVPLSLEPTLGARHLPDMDGLLRALVAYRGQDLHLSEGAVPGVRVDGELLRLRNVPALGPQAMEALVAGVLTDEQKKHLAKELQLDFAYSLRGVGRFRMNAYRQRGGLALAARYIQSRIPSLAELRLPPELKEFALKQQGFVLISGPNGHGKTTTLASLIDVINHERRSNIVSIEDPIEYLHRHRMSNVNQREVGADTKSFADALKVSFRQNPDVIVIGEMRDPESIEIALQAAGTGHLVLASIHANNATSALSRIVESFEGGEQFEAKARLADSLVISLAQRLVKRQGGFGRVVATERVGQSHRVATAIREGRPHLLRGMMQTNVPELSSIEVSLADLVIHNLVAREEAMRWAEDTHYLDRLIETRATPKAE
ncbi:MAG: PilT/PilU family type 4a pilus ATPase [Deltaproteobacteria bacterium]|nr:PilT/PilU family type 4a pilus ATPase [Deltaproteobacteria bacterium]